MKQNKTNRQETRYLSCLQAMASPHGKEHAKCECHHAQEKILKWQGSFQLPTCILRAIPWHTEFPRLAAVTVGASALVPVAVGCSNQGFCTGLRATLESGPRNAMDHAVIGRRHRESLAKTRKKWLVRGKQRCR